MGLFSSPRKKNTKAMRIRKLESKIRRKEKKNAQDTKLRQLQEKWDKMR